jgi:cystathionine beta-lyase/cystathionine gamma-synthase
VETITNPLLEVPDLQAIAELCQNARVPLIVDGTMAGPLNACPLEIGADVLVHSTSKYVSGHNTHGGGVILTNDAIRAEDLSTTQQELQNVMAPTEFVPLREGIRTYPERLKRFNRNGEQIAALLRSHPAVETVYFANQGRPKWLKGMAGVVSCELKDPSLEKVAAFFESPLPGVIKAPSLGSNQTLFCPYVLLAYYDKSDEYLRESNLSKTLLRFAIGCEEDFDPVADGIRSALDAL